MPRIDVDWAAVRRDFQAGESSRVLGARYGVDHTTVLRRARALGWRRGAGEHPAASGTVGAAAPGGPQVSLAAANGPPRRRPLHPEDAFGENTHVKSLPLEGKVAAAQRQTDEVEAAAEASLTSGEAVGGSTRVKSLLLAPQGHLLRQPNQRFGASRQEKVPSASEADEVEAAAEASLTSGEAMGGSTRVKSLPLEEKVPSASEADEVEAAAPDPVGAAALGGPQDSQTAAASASAQEALPVAGQVRREMMDLTADWVRRQDQVEDTGDFRRMVQCYMDLLKAEDGEDRSVRVVLDVPEAYGS